MPKLYGLPVRALNQAVTRNLDRFPEDFMIQLDWEEMESLRSQIVILDRRPERRGRRGMHLKYPPRAFTEQGVAMLSSVLRSKRAVRVNIEIMRAFVRLRALLALQRRSGAKARRARKEIRRPISKPCSMPSGN